MNDRTVIGYDRMRSGMKGTTDEARQAGEAPACTSQITVYHHLRKPIMARQRSEYTRELSVEAVTLVTEQASPVAEADRPD
jgi:hypothetical protein